MEKTMTKIYAGDQNRKGEMVWDQIGIAFVNSDGSINLKIEYLPIDADTQIYVGDKPEGRLQALGDSWRILGVPRRQDKEGKPVRGFWKTIGEAARMKGGYRLIFRRIPTDLAHWTVQLRPPREATEDAEPAGANGHADRQPPPANMQF